MYDPFAIENFLIPLKPKTEEVDDNQERNRILSILQELLIKEHAIIKMKMCRFADCFELCIDKLDDF